MLKMVSCLSVLVSTFIFQTVAIAEEKCEFAGRINFVVGVAEDAKLMHNDNLYEVKAYQDLCVGDELQITSDKTSVSLQLGRNSFEMLQGPTTFKIEVAKKIATHKDNLMRVAGELLLKEDVRLSRRAQSRAADALTVAFPCMSESSRCAVLAAKERVIALQWYGGTSPFDIRLSDCTFNILFKETVEDSFWQTPDLTLQVGEQYCIEIEDSEGSKQRVQFSASSSSELPLIEEQNDEWLTPAQKSVLSAIALANIGPQWAFEAYQRVVPFRGEHPPADTLAEALADGSSL